MNISHPNSLGLWGIHIIIVFCIRVILSLQTIQRCLQLLTTRTNRPKQNNIFQIFVIIKVNILSNRIVYIFLLLIAIDKPVRRIYFFERKFFLRPAWNFNKTMRTQFYSIQNIPSMGGILLKAYNIRGIRIEICFPYE